MLYGLLRLSNLKHSGHNRHELRACVFEATRVVKVGKSLELFESLHARSGAATRTKSSVNFTSDTENDRPRLARPRVVRECRETEEPFARIYPADGSWRESVERVVLQQASGFSNDAELAKADICIIGGEDLPGLSRSSGAREMSECFPRLIVLEISSYPQELGAAQGPAVDILVQARSGLASEHFSDRPIMIAFKPTLYGAALLGLAGIIAALIEREKSGRGQTVRTSLFEGALVWCSGLWLDMEFPTAKTGAKIPKDIRPLIFRCKDGQYIHIAFYTPGAAGATYKVLGIDDPGAQAESGFAKSGGDPSKHFGDNDLIARYVALHRSDELLARLHEVGVAADLVLPPGACWDHPQVQSNALIKPGRAARHVANPVTYTMDHRPGRGPPRFGADTPLHGAKVIDLGTFVAGPFSSVLLSDLGADVIKVEPVSGDPVRASFVAYAPANRGKRNIKIDLKSPRGLEVFNRLCAGANLVANNFRVGVSKRLRVDTETLQKQFPGLSTLECTAFGFAGPRTMEPGFDMTLQAWSGHESRAGGIGNPPLWSRTMMVDFGTGLIGSVAGLACLYHQVRTGKGVGATTSLLAGALYLLSELVQSAGGSLQGAPPLNKTRTGIHPAEAFYQVKDGWLAIAARDRASYGAVKKARHWQCQGWRPRPIWLPRVSCDRIPRLICIATLHHTTESGRRTLQSGKIGLFHGSNGDPGSGGAYAHRRHDIAGFAFDGYRHCPQPDLELFVGKAHTRKTRSLHNLEDLLGIRDCFR
jgi:crotonobetainyl-CoA:carnitine CoA-transferase CaiB-like acyl-CoA transferase